MQTQYFKTEAVTSEISSVRITNIKVYDYLLMLMKANFGFERYILKKGLTSDGSYLIKLAVPKLTLDRHLDANVIKMLKSIVE